MKAEEELAMLREALDVLSRELTDRTDMGMLRSRVKLRIQELETGQVCPICKSIQPRAPRPPPGPRRSLFDHEE